jgi:hypothetical protein
VTFYYRHYAGTAVVTSGCECVKSVLNISFRLGGFNKLEGGRIIMGGRPCRVRVCCCCCVDGVVVVVVVVDVVCGCCTGYL